MKKYYHILPFLLQTFIWIPTRLILLFFVSLKIKGIENLENLKSGVIFASNHASALDPILLPASLPFFSRFMPIFYTSREPKFYDKKWLQTFFSFNLLPNIWGAYSVGIGKHDYGKSFKPHIKILKDNLNLFVFPEGGATRDGKIREAKGGIAYLAHELKKTIVPVAINSTYNLHLTEFLSKKRKITLTFGEPISPKELFQGKSSRDVTFGDYKPAATYIMKKIEKLL